MGNLQRTRSRFSKRRLKLEQLEARRVLAGCVLETMFPAHDLFTTEQIGGRNSNPEWQADGLIDLSHLGAATDWDLQQLDNALQEHGDQHAHDHGGANHDFGADYAEFVFGPLPLLHHSEAAGSAHTETLAGSTDSFATALSTSLVAPVLNSLPGAAATLFLDFDGHFEATWGQYTNVTSPPLDLDGDATSFNADEMAYIEDVWTIVSEDFSALNINVSTVEPPTLAAGMDPAMANGNALRIAIGGGVEILGLSSSIIGYAYYNAFTSVVANVAYVMPVRDSGSISTATTVGSIASHEAGHSFGLRHQNVGFDVSARWQSIMYASNLGYEDQYWTAGTNDQGSFQDDIAVLANTTNGFGLRADDHGDTVSTASQLSPTGAGLVGSGIIGTGSDADVWELSSTVPQGLQVTVEGATLGQNLDAVIELLDASGNVVLTADPSDSGDAQLIFEANGTNYLRVRSTGEYGREGQYTVSAVSSAPGISVTASPTLLTSESSTSDSIQVTLTSRPTSDVVVALGSSNPSEGSLSTPQLVFTPDNWYLPQSATVHGMDDPDVDGPQSFSVQISVTSDDPSYAAIPPETRPALNADDDAPGWTRALQGTAAGSSIYTNDIVVAADGSVLITGSFAGTVDFDPGAGTHEVTATYLNNSYVAKYSATGELHWVRPYGSTSGLTSTYAIALDSAGNAYITGSTSSSSLTLGSTTLTGFGSSDAFLAKLNSQGEFVWARNWGSTASDSGYDLVLDEAGNLMVVGHFTGTVDFNPSSGTSSRTSAGEADGFVSKFDAAGNFLAVTTFGGATNDFLRELERDGSGNLYISGYFVGSTQLGDQTLTSLGSADGFLLKMDAAGNIAWVRQALTELGSGLNSRLSRSSNGTIHWAAAFSDNVNFGPDTPTIETAGGSGIYLASFSDSGAFLHVGQVNSTASMILGDIAVDAQGRLAIYGRMSAASDLDPSAAVVEVAPLASHAEFVVRLDSSGQLTETYVMPTPNRSSIPRDVAFDAQGNVYLSGQFYEGVLTPTGSVLDNSVANFASYLMKLTLAPGVNISSSGVSQVSESGDQASLAVTLATPPTADVVVTVTSSDLGEGTVSPATLTFTPTNWKTPQLVTVSGVDDELVDGNQTFQIQLSVASTDPGYDGLPVSDISAVNADDDAPMVLFADSFEGSEWSGLWIEDSQNDWFRSSQRRTAGNYSAEVDGSASNATLTTANGIDLSGMQSATLTFDWLIESGFDKGEYLSLDISTNGGASWTQDVRRLSGNVSPENVWRSETVDLTPFKSSQVKVRFRAKVSAADEDANVDNVRIVGIADGPNAAPLADAGGAYTMNEGGLLSLNGNGSADPDGSIASYAWDFDGDGQYDDAAGATPAFTTTESGSQLVGLLVTDNRGATATATTTVTVYNVAPTANAGPDASGFVGSPVALSAAASDDPGNDIVSYAWDLDNDGQYDDAAGVTAQFSAAVAGSYPVGLRVTDADGAVSSDSLVITVTEAPSEATLFEDSFEVGEWNGQWVEDAQNDWFRSGQRATDGTRSAEVDGSANNATLTMASGVDLSSFASATLTFDWLIEGGFDRREYVALDISTNGGASWIQDVRRLDGNSSAENVWHHETVDLGGYQTSSLKIRFRSSVSSSTEDANVDNVKIVASTSSAPSASQRDASYAANVDAYFEQQAKKRRW